MKENKILRQLLKKQKEITSPLPNEVGVFTPLYRQIIIYFKVAPYRWLIPLAFILSLISYFIFKNKLVSLVTILQKGF